MSKRSSGIEDNKAILHEDPTPTSTKSTTSSTSTRWDDISPGKQILLVGLIILGVIATSVALAEEGEESEPDKFPLVGLHCMTESSCTELFLRHFDGRYADKMSELEVREAHLNDRAVSLDERSDSLNSAAAARAKELKQRSSELDRRSMSLDRTEERLSATVINLMTCLNEAKGGIEDAATPVPGDHAVEADGGVLPPAP